MKYSYEIIDHLSNEQFCGIWIYYTYDPAPTLTPTDL